GDLTAAFKQYNGEEIKDIPFLDRNPFLGSIHNAQFKKEPTNYRKLTAGEIDQFNKDPYCFMARQEEGKRPASPLPYELYGDGGLSEDGSGFEIRMEAGNSVFGKDSAGSPFIVYAPGEYLTHDSEQDGKLDFEPVRAWHFAVKAGDSLRETWPFNHFKDKNYHLRLYGPNGFYREFRGSREDCPLQIRYKYEPNHQAPALILKIDNASSDKAYEVEIRDEAYGKNPVIKNIGAGQTAEIILDQKKSHGWYDYSLRVKGETFFERRFAGRIENGEETFSDPQLS